jgi:hypothetical protein
MLTEIEIERLADWIIKKDNERLKARYPIPKRAIKMTDDELLAELFSDKK